MTTAAVTPTAPSGNVFDQLAQPANTPPQTGQASPSPQGGNIFDQLSAGTYKDPNAAPPELSPEEQFSKTVQMLPSGLTGMPTPVMNDQDRAEFERGKIAGAISVPAVAGTYLAAHASLAAGIPPLMKALTGGTVAVGEWAAEHPIAAKIIWHSIGAAITGTAAGVGARLAGRVIRDAP